MNWKNKRVLVTGGAGFIPSHVVDALVARGTAVTAFDNLQAGKLENLSAVMEHLRFIQADLRDADAVMHAVEGQEVIFHLAANACVPYSLENPRYDFESNALGTFNVLEAARLHGVGKVIYASSAAVYGEPKYVPMDESHPLEPCSLYGLSKLAGEREGFMYLEMFGLGFVPIRIFNTYGPRQPRYVMADLLRKLRNNPHELEVLGDGTQIRDYSYVSDTAEAIISAAEDDAMLGQAYNVAGGNPISIRDLVTLLLDTLNLNGAQVHYTGQSWKGDITRLMADMTKIRKAGFEPRVPLQKGILKMVEWFQAQEAQG